MAVVGIILSLVLLIYLAYKGWSVILIAPVLALSQQHFQLLTAEISMVWQFTQKTL